MTFLLDTNVCIGMFRGNANVRAALGKQNPDDVYICSPVIAELYVGAYKSGQRRTNVLLIEELLRNYDSLSFSTRESLKFADLFTQMAAAGKTGTVFDVQIAAIAMTHDMTVVTNDIDFAQVPYISIVDWTK